MLHPKREQAIVLQEILEIVFRRSKQCSRQKPVSGIVFEKIKEKGQVRKPTG
jgi:hypothetical protein